MKYYTSQQLQIHRSKCSYVGHEARRNCTDVQTNTNGRFLWQTLTMKRLSPFLFNPPTTYLVALVHKYCIHCKKSAFHEEFH
jgi:hypothetical protein